MAEELLLWKTGSSPGRLLLQPGSWGGPAPLARAGPRVPLLLGPLPPLPRPLRPLPWGTVRSHAGGSRKGRLLKTPLAFPGPSSKQTLFWRSYVLLHWYRSTLSSVVRCFLSSPPSLYHHGATLSVVWHCSFGAVASDLAETQLPLLHQYLSSPLCARQPASHRTCLLPARPLVQAQEQLSEQLVLGLS